MQRRLAGAATKYSIIWTQKLLSVTALDYILALSTRLMKSSQTLNFMKILYCLKMLSLNQLKKIHETLVT